MRFGNSLFRFMFVKIIFTISCFFEPSLINNALACFTMYECGEQFQCDMDDIICQQNSRTTCGSLPSSCPSRSVFVVWRPETGVWYFNHRSPYREANQSKGQWGLTGDVPLVHYEYGGHSSYSVWRSVNGYWYTCGYVNEGNCWAYGRAEQFGLPGDIPMGADFDGDGEDDLVVWRPSYGYWFIRSSKDRSTQFIQWGLPGDLPLTGDYDGDGRTDLAVFRNSNGYWFVRLAANNFQDYHTWQWGLSGDHPMRGDFDEDGIDDLVVWRPSNGTWYVCGSKSQFDCVKAGFAKQWGLPGDVPINHLKGSLSRDKYVVWRPSQGMWYSFPERSDTSDGVLQWGLPGDMPADMGVRTLGKGLGYQP